MRVGFAPTPVDTDNERIIMRVITKDGVGVSALVAAARKIQAVLDEHNVVLGFAYDDEGEAFPVIAYKPDSSRPTLGVYASVETTPTLLQEEYPSGPR